MLQDPVRGPAFGICQITCPETTMMKSKQSHLMVFVLLLIIQVSSCDKNSKPYQYSDEQLENLTLTSLAKVNDYPPIHYMIADSFGKSVIIEFLDDEMKVISNTGPWQVATNFIFSEFDDSGQAECWRYQKACSILEDFNGSVTNSSAMEILEKVSRANTNLVDCL